MINVNLLKSKLVLNGIRQQDLSKHIGVTNAIFSLKMNNKSKFSLEQVKKIQEKLKLTNEEVAEIFLN